MLVLMILVVVWTAVLLPPILRNRRNVRPADSVSTFRNQLRTLERATPGTTLRVPSSTVLRSRVPVVRPTTPAVKRRRRDVLLGLAGATGFTFLLVVAFPGGLTVLAFLAAGGSLAAYVYALRQLQLRNLERAAKVRTLRPRTQPAPVLAMRRVSSS